MAKPHDNPKTLLLGKNIPVVEHYSPGLLYPIPRREARDSLGFSATLPFHGVDLWHAYEMSWLDGAGKPVSRVGRFTVPCTSPHIVESKSFKLYLNSLNNTRFATDRDAKHCIVDDISAVTGEELTLELFSVDDSALAGQALQGTCLDAAAVVSLQEEPNAGQIQVDDSGAFKEETLFSHLLRSLCPVTGQPDWASVWVHYCGYAINHASLLSYIVSYRTHQEFHEQCVERMFRDIYSRCQPQFLHIQAFYTRRGGLDINPFRSTEADAQPGSRLNRQ